MLMQEETLVSSEEVERQEVLSNVWAAVPSLVEALEEHCSDRAITSRFLMGGPPWGTKVWLVPGLPFLHKKGLALFVGSNHEFYLNKIGTKMSWEAKIENRNLQAMKRLLAQLQEMEREAIHHFAYKPKY